MSRAVIVLLVLAGLALAGGSAAASPSVPSGAQSNVGKVELWTMLESLPQLDDTQRKFLILVARGESGWDPLVGLGDPELFPAGTKPNRKASTALQEGEARAARKAYQRHADVFAACGVGHDEAAYGFGSGGWFGMLPANGLWQLRDTPFRCWPPSAVFDPARAITIAIAFARGLQGWDGYQANRTVGNLRAGWGLPTSMGTSIDPDRIAKYRRHATESGLPASFVDLELARYPGDYVGIYQTLASAAVAMSSSGRDASAAAGGDGLPNVLEAEPEAHLEDELELARGQRQRAGAPVSYRSAVVGAFG